MPRIRFTPLVALFALLFILSPQKAQAAAGDDVLNRAREWIGRNSCSSGDHLNCSAGAGGNGSLTGMCAHWVHRDVVAATGIAHPEAGAGAANDWYNQGWVPFCQDSANGCSTHAWGDGEPAPGDLVFWDHCSSGENWRYGHVAVSTGGNMIITTGSSAGIRERDTNMCSAQSQPTGYVSLGGAGGAQCPAGVVDLSAAISLGEWALQVNDYYNWDRACHTATAHHPGGMPGAPPGPPSETGYCENYDCSSLSTWIARQIPGFADNSPGYPGTTSHWFGCTVGEPLTGIQPCSEASNPICWGFSSFGPSSLSGCSNGPAHMFTSICGRYFNASGNSSSPQIRDTPSTNGTRYYIPPGLEGLTMESCSAECTNGTGTTNNCAAPGSPGGPTLPGTLPTGPGGGPACGEQTGGQDYLPGHFITHGGVPMSGGIGTGGPETPECTELYEAQGATESGNTYDITNSIGCVGRFQHCPFGRLNYDCPTFFGISDPYSAACSASWRASPEIQDTAQRAYYAEVWQSIVNNPQACAQVNSARVATNTQTGTRPFFLSQSAILSGFNYTPAWVVEYVATGRDRCDYASSNGGMCLSDYMARHANSVVIDDPWGIDNPNCHGLIRASEAAPPGGGGGPGGGGCPVPPPCGDPALTGRFAHNPCDLPEPPHPPGEEFKEFLEDWWENNFLPAIEDMTTQLYAHRVFETFQIGRLMDALNVQEASRLQKEHGYESKINAYPSEAVCVAGSFPHAITQSRVTAEALTQGFKMDLMRRANNVHQEPPYVDPDLTPTTEKAARWREYCETFYDPRTNGGNEICGEGAPEGPMVNADVSIEGMLLKDTIDLGNPDQYKAAMSLLKNLIRPEVAERIHESVVLTPPGQERIIRQQQLESIYAVAESVVGSIISRRAAMPPENADVGQLISDIRQSAGIAACTSDAPNILCASERPSYNEIMLAMTKERFFDPQYFYRMQGSMGTLKQEQAVIDAYTSVQMQDIYLMQEQINALLAARAALKLKPEEAPNRSSATPLNPVSGP